MDSTDDEKGDDEKAREGRRGEDRDGDEEGDAGEIPATLNRRRHAGLAPPDEKFDCWAN